MSKLSHRPVIVQCVQVPLRMPIEKAWGIVFWLEDRNLPCIFLEEPLSYLFGWHENTEKKKKNQPSKPPVSSATVATGGDKDISKMCLLFMNVEH